ncbi:hypothetical protein MUP07_10155 [Candidatus Bathyarchaeota archaeon]|jgi:predicted nucleic acid-binding protein|nr:hypothetical protein [Candidatus Bathyarchaeota archaeon]
MSYLDHPQGGDPSKRAKQVIDRLRNKGVELKISETSVGELARVVVRDKNDEALLCNLFRRAKENQEFTICGVQNDDLTQFVQLVGELRNEEHLIETTDVLITAQSMIDMRCVGLLTFDVGIIGSKGIEKVRDRHRKGFVITDNP